MRAVLVVDDEPGMRETLTDILEAAGYEVVAAADGAAAIEIARGRSFDLVLTDLRMPVLTGIDVIAALGKPPPQIVLMTAYALEEQVEEAHTSQVFAVLTKPVPVTFLLETVARALEDAA